MIFAQSSRVRAVSAPMVPPVAKAHVGNDDVCAGLGHCCCLFFIEDIRAGKHVELVSLGNHIYLKAVAHAGFFEVLTERTVDKANSGEVLNAVEALLLKLGQVLLHYAEGVGAAYASEHGGVLHNRQNLGAHFNNNLVCIAVGKQASKRAAASHAESTRVVDNEDVGTAGLSGFSRDARTSAYTEQDVAFVEGFAEPVEDFCAGQFKHGFLLFLEELSL